MHWLIDLLMIDDLNSAPDTFKDMFHLQCVFVVLIMSEIQSTKFYKKFMKDPFPPIFGLLICLKLTLFSIV
jgi:hypothetical protein